MWDDPIVSDVRRIREQLAADFNFDVHAIFSDMRSRQNKVGARLVALSKPQKTDKRLHLTGIPLRSIPAGEPFR